VYPIIVRFERPKVLCFTVDHDECKSCERNVTDCGLLIALLYRTCNQINRLDPTNCQNRGHCTFCYERIPF